MYVDLVLNSSNNLVFAAWDLSSSSNRFVDVYIYAPIDLSTYSSRSQTFETCTLVVEAAFLSDKVNCLFSVMPVCIS
jgi:hypothetical protein